MRKEIHAESRFTNQSWNKMTMKQTIARLFQTDSFAVANKAIVCDSGTSPRRKRTKASSGEHNESGRVFKDRNNDPKAGIDTASQRESVQQNRTGSIRSE